MADTIYTTREGDTVDLIAWRFYGTQQARVVEKVLEANPGIADVGAVLPYGIEIALPKLDTSEKVAGVRLWD